MNISIIAAMSDNRIIGKNNELLWYIKDDLKRFKKITNNSVVIMGRKTYESLPNGPLKNRLNIVLTTDTDVKYDKCIMGYGIDDAIHKARYWSDNGDVFIIGGGKIYEQFMSITDKMYLTVIHKVFIGDTYFPKINKNQWKLIDSVDKNESGISFSYLTYVRTE